jgi:hypothetical protein
MTGQERWKLTASDATTEANFGNAVAISGNKAIVAAPTARSAYVFDLTTGTELLKLPVGGSVAISGNIAIVSDSNWAYVFDATTGHELRKLTVSGSVAINGNTAIIGASGDDEFGENAGAAYIFNVTTGEQLAKLTASDAAAGQVFGRGVAMSGNSAIVASPALLAPTLGSAYLFDVSRNPSIPGDFNNDGTVDAADYIVWRNGLGTTYTQTDYAAWRANFGRRVAGTAAVTVGNTIPAVPEPTSVAMAFLSIASLASCRRHRLRLHARLPTWSHV